MMLSEKQQQCQKKKKIAVFNFSASGKLIKKDKLNEVFSEITSAYLAETNRFEVVPRFKLENALLKHNINFDTKLGPKLFNILKQELDLDFLLSGNVNSKIKTTEVNCFLSSIKRKSEVYLTKFKFHSIEELSDVSLKCVSWLQQKIPVEAYIMKVTGKEIIIHGGLDMGFAENDAFNIVNLGEKIYSSDSKNIIGRKRRQVAEGIFKSVSKDTSSGIISGGNINQVDIGSRATVANALTTSNQGIYSFYLKGLHSLSTGTNDEAVRYFTKVIQKDPAYAIAHVRLSTAYYNLNNKTKGKEHLESARKYIGSVTFQERNYILARYATEKDDLKSAKSLYMDILKKYPSNTSAMHNLGILFSGTNGKTDLTQARHYLNKALNINPDLTITRNALEILNRVTPGIKTDNADIVVLFDTTRSMNAEIKGMINNTEKFVSYLNKNGISVRLGLISFGDKLKNVYFENPKRPVLTSNPALFVKHLKSFLPKGGGDAPENPFLAFEKAFSYTFRKDSRKIFLLITDASAHMNDKIFPQDSKYIIQELKKRQISVAIIGPLENHYKRIASETGGILINIKSAPDFTRKILQIGESIIHQF